MSLAETLLRIGVTFVTWLMVYTVCLWLAILPSVSCMANDDSFWLMLLFLSPLVGLLCLTLGLSRGLSSIHETLRYFSLPLVLLVPLALKGIYPTLEGVNFNAGSICDIRSAWHQWWAPVQIGCLGWISYRAFRTWSSKVKPTKI